ncbi:hypothetical protein OIV83_001090 [Microbotryomycetes sp. JL201]|nr:hypothetical protein OIV83_001090 [Microbotryomycetes sp. JL201]
MSDSSKTPSEMTALSLQPPVNESQQQSSDSAPPPSPSYSKYDISSGAKAASLNILINQMFIYPRLLRGLQARRQLFSTHSSLYYRFTDLLLTLRAAPGCTAICAHAVDKVPDTIDKKGSTQSLGSSEELETGKLHDQAREVAIQVPEEHKGDILQNAAPHILKPIQQALMGLIKHLPETNTSTSLPKKVGALILDEGQSSAVDSSTRLVASLSELVSYIETETYAAVTSSYRPYGSPSTVSDERKPLVDAVSSLKAEIRSVKGACSVTGPHSGNLLKF